MDGKTRANAEVTWQNKFHPQISRESDSLKNQLGCQKGSQWATSPHLCNSPQFYLIYNTLNISSKC